MKLVARTNTDAKREQLQRLTERGESVEAREHDEVERECRQEDGQVRDAAASTLANAPPEVPARATTVSIDAPINSICCRISTKAAGTM